MSYICWRTRINLLFVTLNLGLSLSYSLSLLSNGRTMAQPDRPFCLQSVNIGTSTRSEPRASLPGAQDIGSIIGGPDSATRRWLFDARICAQGEAAHTELQKLESFLLLILFWLICTEYSENEQIHFSAAQMRLYIDGCSFINMRCSHEITLKKTNIL